MIITGFRAEKVYGFLEFNIQFNRDVSFLVGGNGSGKTTALRLINAMVTPSFKDLLQIPFDQAWLMLEDGNESHFISVMSDNGQKILHISGVPEKLVLPSYSSFEFEFMHRGADKVEEMMESLQLKYADHEVVKKIAKIQSPVFLGLDRNVGDGRGDRKDFYLEREMHVRSNNPRDIVSKRFARGALSTGLVETEILVQSAYRRLKELEDRQSMRLRDSILLSSFKYSHYTGSSLPEILSQQERARLLNRKTEIKLALSNIGVRNSKLGSELDEFFEQVTTLFAGVAQQSNPNIAIEWLLNKTQIDRMSKIVELIDEHKSRVDDIFKPINSFLSTVNTFFKDSNKILELDAVGKLAVKRPDGTKTSIDGLSSGERQLLVIFAHAYLNQRVDRHSVFIIDEPELSLHMSWQEKFSETIFSINPNAQFIMATHSPEIVGVNKEKSINCR